MEKVGSVPVTTTDPFAYNMMVQDNVGDTIFFLDQLSGIIYYWDEASSSAMKAWDMAEDTIPDGLTLDYTGVGAGQTFKVHSMTAGTTSGEVIIVFSSTTLPSEFSEAHAKLPAEGAFPGYMCEEPELARDLYRANVSCLPPSFTIYDVFYKFNFDAATGLSNPVPFFALENQHTPGHLGGGIITLDDGYVLWGVGDCLAYGSDGRYVPQIDSEHCGKILMINPADSSFEIVAKGIRNSQQMRVAKLSENSKEYLVFTDIGGVTAEEVNAVPLAAIRETNFIENFGWGRNMEDGMAREGTFTLAPGMLTGFVDSLAKLGSLDIVLMRICFLLVVV